MALYQTQSQGLDTRTITSAHLAQTMTLLVMSAEEVREKVESELSNNPALEIIEERICPTCKRKLSENGRCPVCSSPKTTNKEENIVFVSPRDDFASIPSHITGESYTQEREFNTPQQDDLPTYVLRQIAPDLKDDNDKKIAAYLLTSLDNDGFITSSILEIAQYYRVLPSKVEDVIELIQHADPLGVGSRNPQEALLVQLKYLSNLGAVPPFTEKIVKESYEDLMRGHCKELSKMYNLPLKQIQVIQRYVGENLNPFPARAHWGEKIQSSDQDANVLHFPDVLIYYLNDETKDQLVVEVIMPISGYLQVNQMFRKEARNAPEEKAEEWKNDIDRASLLVKCLNQRNNTMVRLMEELVNLQSDFIRHGDDSIVPITRAQIAQDLGVHESTISRAVSNKSVMLPNRKVVPLAAFFDRSLNVRTIIKNLVSNEDKPLTDAKIVDHLQSMGFDVARRTVAKYRAMEGILPAHMRNTTNAR